MAGNTVRVRILGSLVILIRARLAYAVQKYKPVREVWLANLARLYINEIGRPLDLAGCCSLITTLSWFGISGLSSRQGMCFFIDQLEVGRADMCVDLGRGQALVS